MENEPEEKPVENEPVNKVSDVPPVEMHAAPERRESRAASFGRSALRWLLLVALIFAAGMLVAYFALFKPTADKLVADAESAGAKYNALQTEVATLDARVKELEPLEAKNQSLQEENDQLQLHLSILSAINDVTTAHLALKDEDAAAARLALKNTPATLNNIKTSLAENEQAVIQDLETRLENTMDLIERDPASSMLDFQIIETKLMSLENDLFVQP